MAKKQDKPPKPKKGTPPGQNKGRRPVKPSGGDENKK